MINIWNIFLIYNYSERNQLMHYWGKLFNRETFRNTKLNFRYLNYKGIKAPIKLLKFIYIYRIAF